MKLDACPVCNKQRKVEKHRRLCQYDNDETNWLVCCKECKKDDDAHWKEMWAEYYNSQGFGGFW